MISKLTLRNFLSFGAEPTSIPLGPLNVLIGANGSGKSNLIEAISLLAETPRREGPAGAVRRGGGVREWFWKGGSSTDSFSLEAALQLQTKETPPVSHRLTFAQSQQRLHLTEERIEALGSDPFLFFGDVDGTPQISSAFPKGGPIFVGSPGSRYMERTWERLQVRPNETDSILAQYRDPFRYPVLTQMAEQYEQIRIYRDWTIGRGAMGRQPEATDLPGDSLLPNASNLAMVLNSLKTSNSSATAKINEMLGQLADRFDGYETRVDGGTIQLLLREGDWFIPAARLSDGTLRFIALLAILLHPHPPPLAVIEEPELGIHPDLLPAIARLLLEASQKTQIIATTHSEILLDGLTDHPESVLIFDKEGGRTSVTRLEGSALRTDFADSSLGYLWSTGAIGGNRW